MSFIIVGVSIVFSDWQYRPNDEWENLTIWLCGQFAVWVTYLANFWLYLSCALKSTIFEKQYRLQDSCQSSLIFTSRVSPGAESLLFILASQHVYKHTRTHTYIYTHTHGRAYMHSYVRTLVRAHTLIHSHMQAWAYYER